MKLTCLLALSLATAAAARTPTSREKPKENRCGWLHLYSAGRHEFDPIQMVKGQPCYTLGDFENAWGYFMEEGSHCRCFLHKKENCADEVAAVSSESEETTGHSIVSTVHSYQCFDMNSSPQGS